MKLAHFIRRLTLTHILIATIILAGAFLRLWNFRNTLQFLGDQGRDSLTVLHIVRDHHPVLLGAVTSVGNMYLGPLYYYLMIPSFLLTYPDPAGPSYAIAFLSIITIFLMYYLGKEMVGKWPAIIAAFCFSISATVVNYARFSWNPNPAPFFGILLLWGVYRAWKKNPWYWILVSFCIAALIQLHYVTLLALPSAGIFWLVSLRHMWIKRNKKTKWRAFILSTVSAVVLFLASIIPLAIFDVRHNFLNLHALEKFVTDNMSNKQLSPTAKMAKIILEMHGRSLQILCEMFLGQNRILNTALVVFFIGVLLFTIFAKRKELKKADHSGSIILLTFLVIGIVGLAFYQSSVFFHYVEYLYPVTFLIYGVVLTFIWHHMAGKIFTVAFFIFFCVWNIQNMPLQTVGWTVDQMKTVSQSIYERVQPGEKYNLVLLTGTGDIEGQNYRYFLETTDKRPLPKEQWGSTDTLFIINEDKKIKRVTDSPIYEIVVFPNKTPAEVYNIPNGPEITVLKAKK